MIKYKLICKNCKNVFNSWFSDSKEYEKLKKKKYLNCHICDSRKIEKTLMAPKTPAKAIKKVADKQKASASEKKKKSLIQTSGNRGMTNEMIAYLNSQLRKGLDFDDALDKVREKFGHSGDL